MIDDTKATDAVVNAFHEARAAGFKALDCYKLAVDAWLEIHPDHMRTQAAKRAVQILQESFGTIQEIARE